MHYILSENYMFETTFYIQVIPNVFGAKYFNYIQTLLSFTFGIHVTG